MIDDVVDKYGEIKDNASPVLLDRRSMNSSVRVSQPKFWCSMSHYSLGYLDDIKKVLFKNRRVLAVLAMYRRKVKELF
jgi:DNA mismatch repair protein MutS2